MTAEFLSLSTLIVCFITILCMVKFFGKSGLFAYSTIAVIASNMQVLKLTKYALVADPVALGTVIFSTTFAADNIITEYYGKKEAKKCVWLSFFGYLFFVITMKLTIFHPIGENSECLNLHEELRILFSPTLVLFSSSLISYLLSQFTDIFIFSSLKKIFKDKYISCRSFLSMSISTFIDNFIFSLLAWCILAENPISLSSLWKTYIFITYIIRLIIAVLCVPLVKLSGTVIKEKNV